jgi:hypothetical protein
MSGLEPVTVDFLDSEVDSHLSSLRMNMYIKLGIHYWFYFYYSNYRKNINSNDDDGNN